MKVNFTLFLLMIFLVGCANSADSPPSLNGQPLKVVATTSLIADVVHNIGGDTIELTTLIGANQDPHSYEATPSDLVTLEQAHIIFINGWDLEEQLAETIEENYSATASIISAGIEPLALGDSDHDHGDSDHDHDDHGNFDPHVWFSIANVEQWATNAADALTALDPDNNELYAENLASYLSELQTLRSEVEQQLADIPVDTRKLVTNHAAFGYFAHDYHFTLIGTIIPAASTSAEPSASDLVALIETMTRENVCTLFTETSQSTLLAETVAGDLDHCNAVQLLPLYTESVGKGDTNTYIGMFRSNVETIIIGLNPAQ